MHTCVIIPAAGSSSRFGTKDKLAEDLGGRPLLLRTVELFTKRDDVSSIIVAGPPDSIDNFKFLFGDRLAFHGATIIAGGTVDRWETVKIALESVPINTTHIAVHDAARPGTDATLIDRVFEAANSFGAAIPVVPVTSTLKRINTVTLEAAEADPIAARILGDTAKPTNPASAIVNTIDRSNLVEAQTPQVFECNILKRAYANDNRKNATDDASLVEQLNNTTVYTVKGDPGNIKVTTPDDLNLLRAVLGVRPPKDRPTHKRF